jgi:transposase
LPIFSRRLYQLPKRLAYIFIARGYGAKAFVDELIAHGIEPVIPPKQNAKQPGEYDAWRYRQRHLIECFIGKIKHFRRVFSRFDKLARRYLGFLQLTSALIWLR